MARYNRRCKREPAGGRDYGKQDESEGQIGAECLAAALTHPLQHRGERAKERTDREVRIMGHRAPT